MTALTVTTHTQHSLLSLSHSASLSLCLSLYLSCFSGIFLGLNPSDNITQASRTESAFNKYASVSVAGLLLSFLSCFYDSLQIVLSNFIKSGITEHYAHADPDDAPTVTMSVYLLRFVS